MRLAGILVLIGLPLFGHAGDARFMVTSHNDLYKQEVFSDTGALVNLSFSKLTWSDYSGGEAETVEASRNGPNDWTVTRTTKTWNNPTTGTSQSYSKMHATGPADYGDPSPPSEIGPPSFTWGRVWHTNNWTMLHIEQGTGLIRECPVIGTTNIWTEFAMETGGESGSTNQVLIQLGASVNRFPSGDPVPSTNISIMGHQLDEGGAAFEVWTDNETIPGAIAADCTDFTFSAAVQAARHRLLLDGTDITGTTRSYLPNSTNKIWIGTRVNLSVDVTQNLTPITNYLWTLPGNKIVEFVYVHAPGSPGGPRFYAETEKTNATQSFAWFTASTNLIKCEVTVRGNRKFSATATIVVSRPTATVTPQIAQTTFDAIYWGSGGVPPDQNWIHLGSHKPDNLPQSAGLWLQRTIGGELAAGKCQWIQTASHLETRTTAAGTASELFSGLDSVVLEISEAGRAAEGAFTDSPGMTYRAADLEVAVWFSADTYLLWTPRGDANLPAPLWKTTWHYGGNLIRGNVNAVFDPFCLTEGVDSNAASTEYPTWTRLTDDPPIIP
ncbi:MAG: hypothetical protein FJ386_04270 [Verrucomicrobia bacterium]|nr:hypothetical protein [Verrucomicrobiota bacterium]